MDTHTREKTSGEGRKAREPAAHQKPRDNQSPYGARRRRPAGISRLPFIHRESGREGQRSPDATSHQASSAGRLYSTSPAWSPTPSPPAESSVHHNPNRRGPSHFWPATTTVASAQASQRERQRGRADGSPPEQFSPSQASWLTTGPYSGPRACIESRGLYRCWAPSNRQRTAITLWKESEDWLAVERREIGSARRSSSAVESNLRTQIARPRSVALGIAMSCRFIVGLSSAFEWINKDEVIGISRVFIHECLFLNSLSTGVGLPPTPRQLERQPPDPAK